MVISQRKLQLLCTVVLAAGLLVLRTQEASAAGEICDFCTNNCPSSPEQFCEQQPCSGGCGPVTGCQPGPCTGESNQTYLYWIVCDAAS